MDSSNLKQETQKFAFLSRTFLFKSMECIYQVRCPEQVADFIPDEESFFSLTVPKSLSLRQKLSSPAAHGWFSIDISISGTDDIVERWYLLHLPVKQTESVPSLNTNLKELKAHTYRRFSQILRSIYSMIQCFPAHTLGYCLGTLRDARRTLVASCSSFVGFPARINSFCDCETAKLEFGPVVTPLGKTLVICQYRVDVVQLIPCPFTGPLVSSRSNESLGPSEPWNETYGESFKDSIWSMTTPPAVDLSSFKSTLLVDGFELIEETEPVEHEDVKLTLEEFEEMIRQVESKRKSYPVTVEDVRNNYDRVKQLLTVLQCQ